MKKQLSALAALTMAFTMCASSNAFALNYTATLGNASTFETMTEVRANEAAAMKHVNENYVAHPVMSDFPGDTTYVYRSADMYGINAAVRLNTNLVVYSDQSFENKDAALSYLKELGLIDMVDQARGSVILVTPSDPEKGFTAEDQKNYYKLQTAMFAINASGVQDGEEVTYVDASYYGGFGFYYVIGVDGGATFLNNYVSGTLDYVSRIAGMLLVGGDMERISSVASSVPVYLIDADEDTIDKYCEANGTDAFNETKDIITYYNQAKPVCKVMVQKSDIDLKTAIHDAYYNLFLKSVRGQEMKAGLNSASTPYQGYGNDAAPYSLSERNALINGVTADGIHEITTVSDALSEFKTDAGEFVQTWYEYLPDEVLNNTAPAGSVPLLLAIHGGGDDPRQYVDGQGWLRVAGQERIAIVAPEYSSMNNFAPDGRTALNKAFPALVRYMLDKYPALDASRVYVNGYSMGSLGTCEAMYGDPSVFAAAFPQAGIMNAAPTDEELKKFADVKLPVCISTSEYDMVFNVDGVTHNIVPDFYKLINSFKTMNGMEALPEEPDFDQYPVTGFDADVKGTEKMNGEYTKHEWYFLDEDGVPMVGFQYIDDIVHCLYPEYADMVWNFVKHYSRDLTTGAVVYNPYIH